MKNVDILNEQAIVINELVNPELNDWNKISKNKNLTKEFIEKYQDKIDWDEICIYQELSESFMEKYANKLNWDLISKYQKLSEEFIEKHANKVNWFWIGKYQKLSEAFIEKYKDKLDWERSEEHTSELQSRQYLVCRLLLEKKNNPK